MDIKLLFLLASNALFVITLLWAVITMSAYIKPGNGWAFVLMQPIWLFTPSWFTDEGKPYLYKLRKPVFATFALFMASIYINLK